MGEHALLSLLEPMFFMCTWLSLAILSKYSLGHLLFYSIKASVVQNELDYSALSHTQQDVQDTQPWKHQLASFCPRIERAKYSK